MKNIALFLLVAFLCGSVQGADTTATTNVVTTNASPAMTQDNVEFTIGPVYADAPELTVRPDVPQGTLHEFVMKSEDSKMYPGIAKKQPGVVPYERKVCVYVPKQYTPGAAAPFLVAQDGMGYRKILPTILDNMIN